MSRSEARDGHAVRRSADVIEADAFAEYYAGRVPAMFATDSKLDGWPRYPRPFARSSDKLADTINVKAHEGISREYASFDISS